MSDDIVTRLRDSILRDDEDHISGLPDEAADEIERLRAENDRLREGLKFYATEKNWMDAKADQTASGAVIAMLDSVAKDFGDKARTALGEEKK